MKTSSSSRLGRTIPPEPATPSLRSWWIGCLIVLATLTAVIHSAPLFGQSQADAAETALRAAADDWVAGRLEQAVEGYGIAIEGFAEAGVRDRHGWALLSRGNVLQQLGESERAAEDARTALAIYDRLIEERRAEGRDVLDLLRARVSGLSTLRTQAMDAGDWPTAERLAKEELGHWTTLDDANPAGRAYLQDQLGQIDEAQGNRDRAIEHFEQAAELWTRSNEVYASSYATDNLAASLAAIERVRRGADAPARAAPITTPAAEPESDEVSPEPRAEVLSRERGEEGAAAEPGESEEGVGVESETASPASEEPEAIPDPIEAQEPRDLAGRKQILMIVAVGGMASLLFLLAIGSRVIRKARSSVTPPLPSGDRAMAAASGSNPALAWCGCFALLVLIGLAAAALFYGPRLLEQL